MTAFLYLFNRNTTFERGDPFRVVVISASLPWGLATLVPAVTERRPLCGLGVARPLGVIITNSNTPLKEGLSYQKNAKKTTTTPCLFQILSYICSRKDSEAFY